MAELRLARTIDRIETLKGRWKVEFQAAKETAVC